MKVALGCFVEDSPDQKRPSDYHGRIVGLLPVAPHSIPISPTPTGIGKRSSSEPADSIRPPSAFSASCSSRVSGNLNCRLMTFPVSNVFH